MNTLTNSGTIQGGTGASTVAVTNTLTNSGTITLGRTISGNTGSGTINATSIVNSSLLQSAGAMNLNVFTDINNQATGTIFATGNLTIRGLDGAYTVHNSKLVQSNGLLDMKGQNNNAGVTIQPMPAMPPIWAIPWIKRRYSFPGK